MLMAKATDRNTPSKQSSGALKPIDLIDCFCKNFSQMDDDLLPPIKELKLNRFCDSRN